MGQPFQRLTSSCQPNHAIDEFGFASLPPLLLHEMPQLAFHRLERIVDHLGQRGVRAVVHLLCVGDQLVTRRHGDVDAHPELVPFLMRVIGLLDRDITSIDMIAEFFEPGCFLQNELVERFRLIDATIGYIYWPLHSESEPLDHPVARLRENQAATFNFYTGCNERKCVGNFAGSILTRSDFTCSTIFSRTPGGSSSTTAE